MKTGAPKSTAFADADAAFGASLKALFLVLVLVWLTAACARFLLFPSFAAGTSNYLLILPLVMYALVIVAWKRVQQPGLFWHYLLLTLGFIATGLAAIIGGSTTLWHLPVVGILCGILIGFPHERDQDQTIKGLSRRQLIQGSVSLLLILLVGFLAIVNRSGEAREAHILIRSIFAAIAVMLAWSTMLIQFRNGHWLADIKAKLLYIGFLAYFLLFNFAVMTSNLYLNAESSIKLDDPFYLKIILVNSLFLFLILFAFAGKATKWYNWTIALFTFCWAAIISSNGALAIIPILQFIALIALIIRFPSWKVAAAYWAAVLAGPLLGLGFANPIVLTNCLAASVVFACCYWLSSRLESAQPRQVAKPDQIGALVGRVGLSLFSDTRSIAVGLFVAAAVAIVGGLLIYVQYSNERQLAQLRSKAVAERLAERFAIQFEIDAEISRSIGLRAGQSSSGQREIAEAMRDVLPLLGKGHSIQWAPQAVVRLVQPRKGNEHAIGLKILSIDGQNREANDVIEAGHGHWTGPLKLVQGGSGLIYRMPVYEPGSVPSRATFVGLVQIVVNLEKFIADAAENDVGEHGVMVWITNRSDSTQGAVTQLVHGPGDKETSLAEFGWVTTKTVANDRDGDRLHLRILAYPSQADLMQAIPARLQGLLVLALLLAAIATAFDQNRRKTKTARTQLRDSEAFRSALIQGAGAAVIATNADGVITLFNPAAEAMLGYRAEEMIGKATPSIFHDPAEVAARAQSLTNELGISIQPGFDVFTAKTRSSSGETREWTYIRKDGSRITVLLSVTAIRNDAGEVTAFLGVARDISQLKAAEKARTQFIANISHELRTPLNAVLGYSRLLEQAPLASGDREMLQRLSHASQLLFRLVNDVLDWSKIEAGEIDLHIEPFDLAENCRSVSLMLAEQAQKKGISLNINIAPGVPEYVDGDTTRFQQILLNLVDNAIKFTDTGEVAISLKAMPASNPQNVRVAIEVRDTGIGIAKSAQEHLFERFRQVQEGSTRRYQGTGLGLAIVKELAELMGGKVGVKSKTGAGSTFTVELEFGRCEEMPQIPQRRAKASSDPSIGKLTGRSILLVDDSDLVIDLTEWLFNNAAAKVCSCKNGLEALNWLSENDTPDIILMDVQMPVMDGNTAVSILRQNPRFKNVPVIAMTAGATKSNIEDAMNAGSTDYITKPFDPDDLIEMVLKYLPTCELAHSQP